MLNKYRKKYVCKIYPSVANPLICKGLTQTLQFINKAPLTIADTITGLSNTFLYVSPKTYKFTSAETVPCG